MPSGRLAGRRPDQPGDGPARAAAGGEAGGRFLLEVVGAAVHDDLRAAQLLEREEAGGLRAVPGRSLAWVTHVPALSTAALLLGRTVWALGQPIERVQLDQALFTGEAVAYALQIAAASLHFAYGGMLATRLSRGLLHLSQHDGMTGLLNRMAGNDHLEVEWQRYLRNGESFGLLMLDADHFKRINDEHGHLDGDEVLVQLGEVLRRGLRPMDSAARMGGEEFMLCCPAWTLMAPRPRPSASCITQRSWR